MAEVSLKKAVLGTVDSMMVGSEVEVPSSLPAFKLYKVYLDFDDIAPKIEPQTYKTINIIQGTGDVGSIKGITYGDGVPITSSWHTVDSIDPSNFSFSWTIFDGDALMGVIDTATHHMKFIPSSDGGCVYKHMVLFRSKPGVTLPVNLVKLTQEAFKNTFKTIESYAKAHLDDY